MLIKKDSTNSCSYPTVKSGNTFLYNVLLKQTHLGVHNWRCSCSTVNSWGFLLRSIVRSKPFHLPPRWSKKFNKFLLILHNQFLHISLQRLAKLNPFEPHRMGSFNFGTWSTVNFCRFYWRKTLRLPQSTVYTQFVHISLQCPVKLNQF